MRNLGRCLLGVLAVALRQPDSTQVQPFRRALTCVRSLLDFTMMAQYQCHTPETISYMKEYAMQFHETKDIFLEFRISKRTQEKVDELCKELRRQRTQMRERVPPSQRRRICDNDHEGENAQHLELIHSKSNFNFVQMHLISHFRDHTHMFGNILMYSTVYSEFAHEEQIKDGWRISNKIDAARQILSSYGRQHAICMRFWNLEFLQRAGADLPTKVVEHLEKTRPAPTPPAYRRILKGRRDNIHDVVHFARVCNISPKMICQELIRYSQLSLPPEHRLPVILRALPVELLTQLEIPVLAFQESGVYDVHRARCMRARFFRNQTSRNDCILIQAGEENMYGALRGCLPARLIALFKIRSGYMQQDTVYRLAGVQFMSLVDSRQPSDVHGLVTVQLRDVTRELTIVDIGTILGLAHLIPETYTHCRWLVNRRINLRTLNEIY